MSLRSTGEGFDFSLFLGGYSGRHVQQLRPLFGPLVQLIEGVEILSQK